MMKFSNDKKNMLGNALTNYRELNKLSDNNV